MCPPANPRLFTAASSAASWRGRYSFVPKPCFISFENSCAGIDHSSASRMLFVRLEFKLEFDGCFHFPRLEFVDSPHGVAGCLPDPAARLGVTKAQRGRLTNKALDCNGFGVRL